MELAPRSDRSRAARWLVHCSLFLAFGAVGATLLVWPQWAAIDGTRSALDVQREREQEVIDRLDVVRRGTERLRLWEREGRRILETAEAHRFPVLVQAVARREGADVAAVHVTNQRPSRWRSLVLEPAPNGSGDPGITEIRPRLVRMVLKGSFAGVFRTVASLGQQQQLFIPERWELRPLTAPDAAGTVRAEIWATVFVLHESGPRPSVPVASGPVAAQPPLESEG